MLARRRWGKAAPEELAAFMLGRAELATPEGAARG
jgi:hypothetical protein